MRVVDRIVKLPRGCSSVELIVSGCLHFGHAGTLEHEIRRMIDYVAAAENRRLILLGDVTDGISVSDPRFNPREVAKWLDLEDLSNRIILEAERAVTFFGPVKDRIDGLVEGNHESKPRRVNQVDLHRVLWKGLGVESLGLRAFLRYTFHGRDRGDSEPVSVFCEHGAGGASTVGVVLNRLVQRAKDFPGAAIYLGAHHHRNGSATAESTRFDAASGKLVRSSPLVATVGTFLEYHQRGKETYGEMFAMSPHGIGPGKVTIRPWAKKPEERVGYAFPYWT